VRKNIAYLVVAVISLLVSPACRKKSSSNTQACQIITVTDHEPAGTATVNLTYNNQGQVLTKQILTSSDTISMVFTYSGNTEIVQTSGPGLAITDSMNLNSDGQTVTDYESDGTITYLTTNTYSGTELQTSVFTYSGGSTTTTYSWTNGDMTSSVSGSTTTIYSYNTNASEVGDYWWTIQLINFGGDLIRTKHQLASYQSASTIHNLSYTYDNTGKITGLTNSFGSSVDTVSYRYSCK